MVKRNKRNAKQYPAIDPTVNLKSRYEEIMDVASYFNTLPEEAKKFMHSFVEEYVNAKFDHKGKKIHKKIEDKRSIYNRNNARNRDILTRAKMSGKYVELDEPEQKKIKIGDYIEDLIIAKVDRDNELKKKKLGPRKKLKKLDS